MGDEIGKMPNDFDKILDECIDRINGGESLEVCLADYPEYVEQLEPLLQAIFQTKAAYSFVPSADVKNMARQRFSTALENLERKREARQPLFPWLMGWSGALATAAVVVIIALIGYFGLRPVFFPQGTIPQPSPTTVAPSPQPSPALIIPSPQPNPEGNFVFLISDDVNAIADFASFNVTISKIGLLPSGDTDQWLEFEPEVNEVDLTLVQGDKTQEIWRGNIPEGQYTKVFIYVSDVEGILASGEAAVKLPSGKLQISKPFEVTSGEVTNFIYDITVIKAGESGKYILKPQIAESGATHKPSKDKAKDNQSNKG